ncbi:DUF2169 family type VI secretion system accessory protein [Ancylobacter amanitiformis]|uniref:Uncharacterized protein YjbI with pentapeptide repeats n=1 Tax=Ancylobacter amanitiformis TaxID=217069 RepID=A0ABU0LLA0_9HYPH|nr:DUF2169 domain-containing protein [Ancylobacter amanitiformis]MDQ0509469.1 uncharacterized protein YjbI with pentapeptide repeats [Ancylobacter amanitiformis]
MPLVIKPRPLAVLTKVERRRRGTQYLVTVMASFDLADSSRLDGEQGLWMMAAQALPSGGVLDVGMPKPRAELLIGGRIQVPESSGLLLEAQVGALTKRLAVYGDRWWRLGVAGYEATPAQPLVDLLLGPDRAYGGPGHRLNPAGLGFGAAARIGAGAPVALPNVEDPAALVYAMDDEPAPAVFGPMDVMHPARAALAGTYDKAWLQNVAPALADDIHPDFFMTAPPDQRFADYLRGDEPFRLRNFSRDRPELSGRLPALRPRAFVGRERQEWVEVSLQLDTLWLFAGARRGLLCWHGGVPVADMDGKDVTDLMLAYERMADAPRSLDHYAQVRRLRIDPETGPRHAFSEGQLSPEPDPIDTARRVAARSTRARARAVRDAQASDFLITREMDRLSVPVVLRPPPTVPDPDPLPLPTPEDLADGNFDLGALLDALQATTRAAEESLQQLAAQGQPVIDAMADLARPGAGVTQIDALLASLAPLGAPDIAASLDIAAAQRPAPAPDLDGDPVPPVLDTALTAAAVASDWRALLANALQGADDEAVLAAARARFLDLPGARPLAEARASFERLDAVALPPMPDLPQDARPAPPPPADPVAALLATLAASPDLPAAEGADLARQVAVADRQLRAALPGLAASGDGSALDLLLAQVAPSDPRAAGLSADERMAHARSELTPSRAAMDAAESRLMAGIANLRLNAPEAAYPQELFSPHVARSFGDLIVAEARGGLSLRGRDLAGANLAGADLSGLDLSGIFLERANLANTRLVGAILVDAALTQARLDHADLSDADLTGANLSGVDAPSVRLAGARLVRTRLMKAGLRGALMQKATLRDVQALEADLDGADLAEARLDEVMVLKATMRRAAFTGAQLRQCQFLQTDMTGVDFSDAFVDRCGFLKVNASGMRAVNADLRGSNFIGGTDLTAADCPGVLASDCSFFGANLTGARFPRAVLDRSTIADAQLAGADFRLASLRRIFADGATLVDADFIGAQMMEAQLHRADLVRATLRGANLYGADLSDANLAGADFTGANLANTILVLETSHA